MKTVSYPEVNDITSVFAIRRFAVYKIILVFMDIAAASLSFFLGAWIIGFLSLNLNNPSQLAVLFLFALITISFYSTYSLYNFHFIFLKKLHLVNMFKAYTWGFLTFLLTLFLYNWTYLFEDKTFYTGLFFFVSLAFVLILKRYFNDQLLNLVKSLGISLMVIGTCGLLLPNDPPSIIVEYHLIFLGFAVAAAAVLFCRLFLVHFVFYKVMRRSFRRQILIVGSDDEATNIANHVINNNAPFWIAGNLGVKEKDTINSSVKKGCLGMLKDLPNIVNSQGINEIIITDGEIDKSSLIYLLDYCTNMKLTAWFPPNLLKIIDMKLHIDNFCGIPMIKLCLQRNSWIFNKIKHLLDFVITFPCFVLHLPIFLGIAAAIKLDSAGPVFYRATAIGRGGKEFKMFKFRSMVAGSDKSKHKQYVSKLIKGEIGNESSKGEVLKITDDPRVTKVGRFIRKYSVDELPQLINVLKGEMSLVGPRPCLPYEYEIYKDWHKKRVVVRPGITGLWQVTGRSEVSFEDMIFLDLYYIYNRNLIMDLNIILETFSVVFQKRGAY